MSKRLLIIIGVVAVLVLGLAGFALALALAPHSGQASTSNATTTPTTTTSAKTRSVTGVIQTLGNSSFVIRVGKGKRTMTVNVSAQTKISTVQGAGSFSDLQVGEMVQVKGSVNTQAKTIDAVSIIAEPPSGTVAAIKGQTFTLTTSDGKTLTVNASASTSVYVNTVPVSLKAIEIGQTLGYQGTTASDGSITAGKLWLLSLPQVRGKVTAINGNSLTLQTATSSVTINLSPNTTYAQRGKASSSSTPTSSSIQSIQVGSQLTIAEDAKSTSGTPTAVLVLIA